MSPANLKRARDHFPEASVTIDRFHVMKLLNDVVDQVRREEQKEQPELKRTRWIWLRNPHLLRRSAQDRGAPPRRGRTANCGGVPHQARVSEVLGSAILGARLYLYRWYNMAVKSALPPVVRVATTLLEFREQLINWFRSKASNGLLEGTSSLIQAAKARARGYRSVENLITMIYMLTGKFSLPGLPI